MSPVLADRAKIRRLLRRDSAWALYALGDLQEPWFRFCKWYEPDLGLVFRRFEEAVLFAMGPASVGEAIAAEGLPLSLQLQPDAFAAAASQGLVTSEKRMWRMRWTGDRGGWVKGRGVKRLSAADVDALTGLYADGAASGEAPDFFYGPMVTEGRFYGAFHAGKLVAAAGTHIFSPREGVAAIGNVYTHRDHRGRGLAKLVTCAVLRDVAGAGTVGLNVRQDNPIAIRVYESLGFRCHCEFFEGVLG